MPQFFVDVEQTFGLDAEQTLLTCASPRGPHVHFPDLLKSYFPWDLDAVFRSTTGNIYASGSGRKVAASPYQEVILRHPTFRAQYNNIMLDLLNGPLAVANVQAFLTQTEAVISSALANDPFPTTDSSPADEFNQLRAWVAARDANVRSQLAANGPPSPRP